MSTLDSGSVIHRATDNGIQDNWLVQGNTDNTEYKVQISRDMCFFKWCWINFIFTFYKLLQHKIIMTFL
jgi:hypothetical protein